jgi:hypothetical protein
MTEIVPELLLSVGRFALSNTDEMADECWTGSLFAGDGFSPRREFRKCVERISREFQCSEAFTHGAGFYVCDLPSPNFAEVLGTTGQQ